MWILCCCPEIYREPVAGYCVEDLRSFVRLLQVEKGKGSTSRTPWAVLQTTFLIQNAGSSFYDSNVGIEILQLADIITSVTRLLLDTSEINTRGSLVSQWITY